jgi:NAD-dependent SIR2 family protein deacetylase
MARFDEETDAAVARAAEAVRQASAILIACGAGMGVDSGLPDFRGKEGFWRAYPAYRELGLSFVEMANPGTFRADPALAWGFYGHRLGLYRRTRPHGGFEILRRWGESKAGGCFVFTSNVDGQFQRAGFDTDRVVEVHGSIHHLQCTWGCTGEVWSAEGVVGRVDDSLRAIEPLPRCPRCGELARPNILMFGDGGWLGHRTAKQEVRYEAWLEAARQPGGRAAVIEIGAGEAIPTVRMQSEAVARRFGGRLVRINPRDVRVPAGEVGLAMGAVEALERIDGTLQGT